MASPEYVVNFGSSNANLADVGVTVYDTTGVAVLPRADAQKEYPPGSGSYAAALSLPVNPLILWDTGTNPPTYACESFQGCISANFGPQFSGLTNVGYTLYQATGTVQIPRTTSAGEGGRPPVVEIPGTGIFLTLLSNIPINFTGFLIWDTGGVSPTYAAEEVGFELAVDFGTGYSGLSNVGVTLYHDNGSVFSPRISNTVMEFPAGTGIYWLQYIQLPANLPLMAFWDTATIPTVYAMELFGTGPMLGANFDLTVITGTVGYTVYNPDQTVFQARTTTGIFSLPGNIYGSPYPSGNFGVTGVVSWDTAGTSPVYSDSAFAGTGPAPPPPPPTPGVPVLQAITVGNTILTLNWTPTAPLAADSYDVWRGLLSGGETFLINTNSTATTYQDTGLVNGTTYFYKVAAHSNLAGSSALSNEQSAAPTAAPPPPPPVPTVPSVLPNVLVIGRDYLTVDGREFIVSDPGNWPTLNDGVSYQLYNTAEDLAPVFSKTCTVVIVQGAQQVHIDIGRTDLLAVSPGLYLSYLVPTLGDGDVLAGLDGCPPLAEVKQVG